MPTGETMDFVTSLLDIIHGAFKISNTILWGLPMIVLLVGTHIYMTIRTKGIQRKIISAIKFSISKDEKGHGDVSQFGALSTALAATIGTGNIIGVGTAITLGGPGAIFWMWIVGIFGMATKYAESLIAVKYRVVSKEGLMQGGAMYALDKGLNMKWLGVLFAIFASLAAFGIGCSVQSNAVATTLEANFSIPVWVSSLVIGLAMVLIIFGGVKSIAKVCEKLVPFMAFAYIICCILILILLHAYILDALKLIMVSAFDLRAAGGGALGAGMLAAMRYGVARGLFSNESGMGSGPIIAASAKTINPARQSLVSMSATFWDTVVVCLLTGLMLVASTIAHPELFPLTADGMIAVDGGRLTSIAFGAIPYVGTPILTISLTLFAFTTILGWSYYGERAFEYLVGYEYVKFYRVAYTIMAMVGALVGLGLIWDIADTLNALMVIPNLVAVIGLAKVISDDTDYYVYQNHLDEYYVGDKIEQ